MLNETPSPPLSNHFAPFLFQVNWPCDPGCHICGRVNATKKFDTFHIKYSGKNTSREHQILLDHFSPQVLVFL